jgi:hypothetical protein
MKYYNQSERFRLKELASRNILAMVVTLDTSQLDRSPVKTYYAAVNIPAMVVTLDTSQVDMSPLKTKVG